MPSAKTDPVLRAPRLPRAGDRTIPQTLSDQADYQGFAWVGASFARQAATRLILEQGTLQRVTLAGARCVASRWSDLRLEQCDAAGLDLERAHLRRLEWLGGRLLGARFVEAQFEDVLFRDDVLEDALFVSATFKNARFEQCRLARASFAGADLTGVVFAGCDLSQADLRGASLAGTDLRGSTLDGLLVQPQDLAGAIIEPAQAVQVVGLLGVTVRAVDIP